MPYLKSYTGNRDKHVQSLSRGVCRGGVKGIRLWSGAPESPLSIVPERPCYATEYGSIALFQIYGPQILIEKF